MVKRQAIHIFFLFIYSILFELIFYYIFSHPNRSLHQSELQSDYNQIVIMFLPFHPSFLISISFLSLENKSFFPSDVEGKITFLKTTFPVLHSFLSPFPGVLHVASLRCTPPSHTQKMGGQVPGKGDLKERKNVNV